MDDVDVPLPSKVNMGAVIGAVERACTALGLRATLKSTYASYPGSTHWHYKSGDVRGTLGITWWPGAAPRPRLWLSIQSGRTGDWIDDAVGRLVPAIERAAGARRR